MAEVKDIEKLERKAGRRATSALKSAIRSQISKTFTRRSGTLEKSDVSARFNQGRLDRLVLSSPHYSFKLHFGSVKKGKQMSTMRKLHYVSAHMRRHGATSQFVAAHRRKGGHVKSMIKNIDYPAFDHLGKALKSTNALEQLATDIAENRAVTVTSQIDF